MTMHLAASGIRYSRRKRTQVISEDKTTHRPYLGYERRSGLFRCHTRWGKPPRSFPSAAACRGGWSEGAGWESRVSWEEIYVRAAEVGWHPYSFCGRQCGVRANRYLR